MIQKYEKSILLDPKNSSAWSNYGNVFHKTIATLYIFPNNNNILHKSDVKYHLHQHCY